MKSLRFRQLKIDLKTRKYPAAHLAMLNLPFIAGCALQGGSERKHRRLQFGQFEADLENQQLYKRGLPVRLEKLPFLVLTALLERPGSAVSREELRTRLWPNGTHVDFDEGLNTAVRKLRQALGDSADTPLFIERDTF